MHKVAPLLLVIIVAFSIGTLSIILDTTQRETVAPAQKEESVSYQVTFTNLLFPLIITLWIVVILAGFTGVKIKGRPLFPDHSWKETLALIIVFGIFAVIIFKYFKRNEESGLIFGRRLPIKFDSIFDEPLVVKSPTNIEMGIILLGSAILLLVIIVIILTIVSFSRKRVYAGKGLLERIQDERRKSRTFSFEGSPRDIVINVYGASCDHLEGKGFKFDEGKTPAEYKSDIQNPHLESLTDLFEEARYSDHNISSKYSRSALSHYRRLKDEY